MEATYLLEVTLYELAILSNAITTVMIEQEVFGDDFRDPELEALRDKVDAGVTTLESAGV